MRRPLGLPTLVLIAALLTGAPRSVSGQVGESDSVLVWAFLEGPAAEPGSARPALGQASLERRAGLGLPLRRGDYPLRDDAVRALEAQGLRVRHRSRWLRAVSGWIERDRLAALERVPGVRSLRRVAQLGRVPVPEALSAPRSVSPRTPDAGAGAAPPPAFYGRSAAQVAQIGVPLAHDLGLTGAGVRIALLDTGFRDDHEALAELKVLARRDFIQDDTIVANEAGDASTQDHHGTRVWSILAGSEPGKLIGPAYGATFLLAKTDDVPTEPRADEDRWVAAIEWADSMGAAVVNSSLAYLDFDDGFVYPYEALNGDRTVTTRAADEAARRGILVVTAMGNAGPAPASLNAPADADSALAVGAVDADDAVASFSSRGPTADGRAKPELVARGVATAMAMPNTFSSYTVGNGTSYATPLLAGGAALFLEAWPDLTGPAAHRALILSAPLEQPDNARGYGLPDVASAILFPQGIRGAPGVDRFDSLLPEFVWHVPLLHPDARPVRYIVQLSSTASFGSVLTADTVVDAQRLTFSRAVPAHAELWWRVVAEADVGVTRASAPVGPVTMPDWVELLTLNDPDGVFIADRRPELAWVPLHAPAPVGPLRYDVAVLSAGSGDIVWQEEDVSDTTATVDAALQFNQPYRWRVIARTTTGAADTVLNAATFVVVSGTAPPVTLLYQNFPNPFPRPDRPGTSIWFDLARPSQVHLRVYDLHGRLVRRLIPDAREGCGTIQLEPGAYGRDPASAPPCVTTRWDGDDDGGRRMPAGVYLIRLETDHARQTVRTLLRP